ncbi:unnamed protein product [Diatraea saccharalis]|uniref:MOSC domain-containing protein n=1 Tax=Diatraea saccharalis TaxID=40085 RepID=A0A9P0FYL4_9NEOP|nr:unnamed protein product [Diatraea saccharalis]
MSAQGPYITAAAVAAGVLGGAYCAYRAYEQINKTRLPRPEDWRQVGTLKDLYVYPIKSCAPQKIQRAECTQLGLRDGWLRDRIMMVVDQKNNFVTARKYPEMLLVHPTVRNSILTLTHPNKETIHVNLAEVIALQKPELATVWGVEVPVFDCGSDVSKWFSSLINHPTDNFKLVYYSSENCRTLGGGSIPVNANFKKDDTGALSDEVPFNLINQASVDDLNERLEDLKVSPCNFRPNFVLSGTAKPYEEDNWKFIKIGQNIFEVLKPCTRCLFTTIDPETGVRNAKAEPFETLKSYRVTEDPVLLKAIGNSPCMGLQISLRSGSGGQVALDEPIYVA